MRCDAADGASPPPQQPEDLPPCRIRNRPKHRSGLWVRECNHKVSINVTTWLQIIKRFFLGGGGGISQRMCLWHRSSVFCPPRADEGEGDLGICDCRFANCD